PHPAGAGRTGRRHEPVGNRGAEKADGKGARRRRDHPADRARRETDDGAVRPHRRARVWQEDRRGRARSREERSARDRSVPGSGAGMSDALLKVEDLKVAYGGIHAVKGINLEVKPGELVALIGANGAGKSTTLKTLVGMVKPAGGRIVFN